MSDPSATATDERLQVAEVYRHTFAARLDAYATWTGEHWSVAGRYESGDDGKPVLVERYELTPERVLESLAGTAPPVSGYMEDAFGMTHVGALDLDRDDGWELGLRVAGTIAADGGRPMLERSRRGAHLWLTVDATLPGDQVRLALREWVRRTDPYAVKDTKVEYRPAKITRSADSLGTPLRMPMMRHPATGRRYPLCDATGEPIGGNITAMVLAADETDADLVVETARDAKIPTTEARQPDWSRRPAQPAGDVIGILLNAGVPNAVPGRAVKCPLHDDQHPSLSISRDGERVWCKAPACAAYNNGRGLGADQLARALGAVTHAS